MSLKQQLFDPANAGSLSWLLSKFPEVSDNYENFSPSKLEAVEVLGIWTQRFLRHNALSESEPPTIEQVDNLIRRSIERWTEGDPAYKGALMKSLKEILVLRQRKFGLDISFAELVHYGASYIKSSPRTTFGVLEVFARSSRETALHTVSALDTSFFVESFQTLAEQSQRGGLIGRCLAALLSDADPQVWYDYTAQHLDTPSELQNVIIYFLEPSLKQSKRPFDAFSQYLGHALNQKLGPSVEIAILKAAMNANLDISEHVHGSAVLAQSLSALSKTLRFDAFALLCRATRKLTLPVPRETYQLIRDNAPSLFAEGDPQSRADVISCLRHLMLRINTSTKKHPSEDAKQFINFLLGWSAMSLRPGMPYRCLAMAANILVLLSDHSVDVHTPEVSTSLLNSVASDFGDIRETSVLLLRKASALPMVDSGFGPLVGTALNLVSRSRTGDAGARLFEFLNSRHPEFNLGEVVLTAVTQAANFAKTDLAGAVQDHSIHGFFIALRVMPYFTPAIIPVICEAWDACVGPLLVNAPEGTDDKIMNYCWKAVKDSCALLESIALSKPALVETKIEVLVQRLATMLTEITHWGAFSAVPPAYRAVAGLNPKISSNIVWQELRALQSKQSARLVTRRSAGLPMLVASALIVDFDASIVETLFELAELPFINTDENEKEDLALPQVHGMNCLNAFITDTALSKRSAPYLERTLQLALDRYTSPSWSLRNSAAMLFAKLHTRLFGPKTPTMAADSFFSRFKSMPGLLKKELVAKTRDSDLHSVYPALAIIANLHSNYGDALVQFWEPIVNLLGSKSWKVREMAARALVSATRTDSISSAITSLVKSLSLRDQNNLHGTAMAINQLIASSALAEINDPDAQKRLRKIISVSQSMETNSELYKAFVGVGGSGRIIEFDQLPTPLHLNPSVATFEAEQALTNPTDVARYGDVKWIAVLRMLPYDKWNLELANIVLSDIKLPDVQCRCLEALQNMEYTAEIGTLAARLISVRSAQSTRQQALVLSSKASDLDVDHWLQNLVEFSLDEAPLECRKSAIESLQVFLTGPLGEASLSPSQRSVLFYRLFKLLSDDDEIVRDRAALVSSGYLKIAPSAPPACESLILSKVSPEYVSSQLAKNIGTDAMHARDSFDDPEDILFVVEKESLFRDELRNIQIQGKFCKHFIDLPASQKLQGLDWTTPFQAGANAELLEVRERVAALLDQ